MTEQPSTEQQPAARRPVNGAAVIGAETVSRLARRQMHSGDIAWVARGIKLGVVRIYDDSLVAVKFFGGSGESFFEQYARLRPGDSTVFRGVTITLVQAQPDGQPRRWARFAAR
ncbi:MAG: hypothetical protein ACRDTS_21985 [Mycobacterium sp.]